MTKEIKKEALSQDKILQSLKSFGPNLKEIPSFIDCLPYATFNKQERLGKVADWTVNPNTDPSKDNAPTTSFRRKRLDDQAAQQASMPSTLFNYQHQEADDASFSVVDRQAAGLKKSAIRSVRPAGSFSRSSVTSNVSGGQSARNSTVSQTGRGSSTKRPARFGDKQTRTRDPSIPIQSSWKLIEELNFNRMTNLYFEVDEPEDLSMYGYLNYYDKAFDKVTVKTEANLPPSIPPEKGTYHPAPNPSADSLLKTFGQKISQQAKEAAKNAQEGEVFPTRTVISSDVIIAALMSCTKSVYSWDLIVDKRGDTLMLDKREGGALDFNFVNENAADPPVESVEKDTNINSHDALAREATLLNQTYPAHILKSDEKIVFKNQNPFIEPPEQMIPTAVSSGAERYRKWEMDDVNLVLRTRVHACMQTKNLVPAPIPDLDMESCGDDLNETGLVNIYALNEFDHRAAGSGGSFEWRKKLDSQRGAVIATEMKNNAVKLARWTIESLLSGVDYMRLGFLSRTSSRSRNRHQILGSNLVKPNDFVKQIAFNLGNGWGIVKALIDECFKLDDGMYILLRDPVKPALILYQVSTAPLKERVVVE